MNYSNIYDKNGKRVYIIDIVAYFLKTEAEKFNLNPYDIQIDLTNYMNRTINIYDKDLYLLKQYKTTDYNYSVESNCRHIIKKKLLHLLTEYGDMTNKEKISFANYNHLPLSVVKEIYTELINSNNKTKKLNQ